LKNPGRGRGGRREGLLREEEGGVRKEGRNLTRVCLAYPNRYETGMNNLGFLAVYRIFNDFPTVACERAFYPDPGEGGPSPPGSLPILSVESQSPLRSFAVVAFSVSFENDYPRLVSMLLGSRIPPLREERREEDPLVMAGGIAATMNPEPLSDFVDLFLIGEAEASLPAFIARYLEARRAGMTKGELLEDLQRHVRGVYVPSLYNPSYGPDGRLASFEPLKPDLPRKIKRPFLEDLDAAPAEQTILPRDAALSGMYLTEVSRGCGRGCRFCAAGYHYRPPRFRGWDSVRASLERGLAARGRIGLVGTAVSDHPHLERMGRFVLERGGRLAVGSLRVDALREELVGLLARGGIETPALAPEAGSQELRDLIRKGIDDEGIMAAAAMLLRHGIVNLRLYFLIGLPTEGDGDAAAIADLARRIAGVTAGGRRFRRITLSVNPFVPKAGTPLQWYPLADAGETRRRIRALSSDLRREAVFALRCSSPREAYLQALFSLGDRRVGGIILHYVRTGSWPRAFREAAVSPDFFVYRPKDPGEVLPWDFIDTGVPRAYLVGEYERTVAAGRDRKKTG